MTTSTTTSSTPVVNAAAPARTRRLTPRTLRDTGIVLGGVVGAFVAWHLGAQAYGKPLLVPGPAEVWSALVEGFTRGSLVPAIGASLGRVVAGLAIGVAGGVVLGLLSGSSRILEALFEPFINVFRFIPPLAWFAPVLLWLGTGESSKIVLIVYTSIFVVAVNTAAGVQAVPQNMVRMASTYGAKPWHMLFIVRLPASVPYILAGVRIAMGNAFMTVVTAEMLGARSGLGVIITTGSATTDVRGVFAALITLGVLGLGADRLFVTLLRRYGGRFAARTDAAV